MNDSLENYFKKQETMLYNSNIQLSASTIHGWYGVYLRMIRFYNRAKNSENSSEDELDFYIVFFQNCFHLREWIIKFNKNQDKIWKNKIENNIANRNSMKICRDISNHFKHLKLSNPSLDGNLAFFYEYRPYHKTQKIKENGWSLFISENNNKNPERFPLEEIAKDCVDIWQNFLINEKLINNETL